MRAARKASASSSTTRATSPASANMICRNRNPDPTKRAGTERDNGGRDPCRLCHRRRGQRGLRAGQPADARPRQQGACCSRRAATTGRCKEPSQFLSNMMIHTPIGFGKTLNDPKVNWLYETEPDRRLGRAQAQMAQGQGARRLLLDQRHALRPRPGGRLRRLGADGRARLELGRRAALFPQERRTRSAASATFTAPAARSTSRDFPEQHPVSQALLDACVEAGIPYRPTSTTATRKASAGSS